MSRRGGGRGQGVAEGVLSSTCIIKSRRCLPFCRLSTWRCSIRNNRRSDCPPFSPRLPPHSNYHWLIAQIKQKTDNLVVQEFHCRFELCRDSNQHVNDFIFFPSLMTFRGLRIKCSVNDSIISSLGLRPSTAYRIKLLPRRLMSFLMFWLSRFRAKFPKRKSNLELKNTSYVHYLR